MRLWPKRAPTEPEIVVPDDEMIAAYLKNPLFKARIREVAAHTADHYYEGGFAVYRTKGGGFAVSKAILPDPSWWLYTHRIKYFNKREQEKWHPRQRFPGHMLTEKYIPGIRADSPEQDANWRQDPSAYRSVRKDLLFFLHSHPGGMQYLVPSVGDIGHWSRLERKNPFFVDALLTSERGLTNVLFWRRNTGSPYAHPISYYDEHGWVEEDHYSSTYDTHPKHRTDNFLAYAKGIGLNAVRAVYDHTYNQFYPGARRLAAELTK